MLEEEVSTKDGEKILLRPIRPEDEHLHFDFINQVSEDDWHQRFIKMDALTRAAVSHEEMSKFTHIDYDREMAFMA
eukprot:6280971-Amphidinium_carterae.1